MYMWGTCIKFIIFVQSTSLWYICKYWIKRDFATFIYIYVQLLKNKSFYLFPATSSLPLKTLFVPVLWPQSCQKWLHQLVAVEVLRIFPHLKSAVYSLYQVIGPFYSIKIHPLLLTYSPLAFRHRNGIFAWLHSLNPHCLKCIDVKANRKKSLQKKNSNFGQM